MDIDWREMFGKYVDIVGTQEGVSFLNSEDWSEAEWEAIAALYSEVLTPKGWLLPT